MLILEPLRSGIPQRSAVGPVWMSEQDLGEHPQSPKDSAIQHCSISKSAHRICATLLRALEPMCSAALSSGPVRMSEQALAERELACFGGTRRAKEFDAASHPQAAKSGTTSTSYKLPESPQSQVPQQPQTKTCIRGK